ncbi:MAG: sensor histidine kinase, partial [Stellaceae bacterium]
KLKQVLLNLLSNAVKFTPPNGQIAIAARSDAADGFVIAIRDTGIGISREDMQRVLQPFEQVENSLSRSHNGTGLGLPLTAAMMELHGGSLAIDSAIEAGTTATIRFPPERLIDARTEAGQAALVTGEEPDDDSSPTLRHYG